MNNYQNRRNKLFENLAQGSLSILFSGSPVRKSADADYPFEANRNFYYLTGIDEPEAVLVLIKTAQLEKSFLFIRDIDEMMEKWVGIYIRPQQAQEISGVDQVLFRSTFKDFLGRQLMFNAIDTLYLDGDRQRADARPLEGERFALKMKKSYPLLNYRDLSNFVFSQRLIKDDQEIAKIRHAIDITNKGLQFMLKNMKPQQFEYEYLADVRYVYNKHGASEMFDSIVASGPNGVILHYVSNDRKTSEGDLCLFDLGAKKEGYGADISRTYPVSGQFSERQKQLYTIVLGAMERVKAFARPGVTLAQLNQQVIDYYGKALVEIGLIQDKSEVSKYYYHSVSHFLGLDTHDVGGSMGLMLEPGHVITNEPGLYIEEEQIGIRLENDLLITENGCEDLCVDVPLSIADIESIMKR